jgi:hypothetical protein
MIEVQKKAFNNALQFLKELQCQYLIIDADGNEYGQLDKKGKKKRLNKYPYGALTKHVRMYLDSLDIGQAVLIPFEDFKSNDLQSTASAYAQKLWGIESYHSHVNKENKTLEFIRVA